MLKKINLMLVLILTLFILPIKVGASTGDYNISIDGNMSDWADKPKTIITPYDSIYNNHNVSLVSDSENIYFYVQMAQAGDNNTMITAEYQLNVGGVEFVILMADVNNPYSGLAITKDTMKIGETKSVVLAGQLRSGSSTTLTSSYAIINDPNAKAVITRTANGDSFVDEMEVQIPFSALGIESTVSQTITLTNPNLGSQQITTSGGSTGGVILVIVAGLLSVLGYVVYTKKKKSA